MNQGVCLRDGYIDAIGPSGRVTAPSGARVVDAAGAFLIPGLWDMHANLVLAGEAFLPMLVAAGVTSVRDIGGGLAQLDDWRDRIEAGFLIGPRILAAGPSPEDREWLLHIWQRAEAARVDQPTTTSGTTTSDASGARLHPRAVAFIEGLSRRRASLTWPAFGVHDELELLVRHVGWRPLQALIGATRLPAEYFGLERELGTIEPGKVADLVLLGGDPLIDVRYTRHVRAVIRAGRLLERADLDRLTRTEDSRIQG
jgi:imidazolonepropionase-like amidohydrolase